MNRIVLSNTIIIDYCYNITKCNPFGFLIFATTFFLATFRTKFVEILFLALMMILRLHSLEIWAKTKIISTIFLSNSWSFKPLAAFLMFISALNVSALPSSYHFPLNFALFFPTKMHSETRTLEEYLSADLLTRVILADYDSTWVWGSGMAVKFL